MYTNRAAICMKVHAFKRTTTTRIAYAFRENESEYICETSAHHPFSNLRGSVSCRCCFRNAFPAFRPHTCDDKEPPPPQPTTTTCSRPHWEYAKYQQKKECRSRICMYIYKEPHKMLYYVLHIILIVINPFDKCWHTRATPSGTCHSPLSRADVNVAHTSPIFFLPSVPFKSCVVGMIWLLRLCKSKHILSAFPSRSICYMSHSQYQLVDWNVVARITRHCLSICSFFFCGACARVGVGLEGCSISIFFCVSSCVTVWIIVNYLMCVVVFKSSNVCVCVFRLSVVIFIFLFHLDGVVALRLWYRIDMPLCGCVILLYYR